jgi:excisionase family DNA binding protein
MEDKWLTLREAGQRAGVGASRLRQLIGKGRFPNAWQPAPRLWLIRESDLVRWLESSDRDRRYKTGRRPEPVAGEG